MMQVQESHIEPHGGYVVEHPTKRMAFHVVPDLKRPFKFATEADRRKAQAKRCPTCQVAHLCKTYHILLNEVGKAVVSPTVYKGLLQAGAFTEEGGLRVITHTTKPPNQILGARGGMMGIVPQRQQTVIYHE